MGMSGGLFTRYSKGGKEIQSIRSKDELALLTYEDPYYITENINGDICLSDYTQYAVVVVNKSGQYRITYIGLGDEFCPAGICTDVLGHILVCDTGSKTVHLLDQDARFLSVIHQRWDSPCGVCVDDENNLYVGHIHSTVKVYKYLE